jgi:peptidoglycan/LPS O-acetylase OafA/YrhL
MNARLDWVDGLRGIAVGMVLMGHSFLWAHRALGASGSGVRATYIWLFANGYQGVSLFFVLSGVCLSLPLWHRRFRGQTPWFPVHEFFLRRCRRILPPYYAALALTTTLALCLERLHQPVSVVMQDHVTAGDVAAHVVLVHNMTPWASSIDAPFWSLGLEWQWYAAFPLLLILCVRWPRLAVGFALGSLVFWHLFTHDLWTLYVNGSAALPARLTEFVAGILVARHMATGDSLTSVRKKMTALGLIAGPASVVSPVLGIPAMALFGSSEPLWAASFACLVLLGHEAHVVQRVLSWRPLVALGVCSYSVYLIHFPIMQAVESYGPDVTAWWPIWTLLALALGIGGGVLFYRVVEQPCLAWYRRTRRRTSPAPVLAVIAVD